MDFFKIWPGKKILVVFGKKALDSVYSQSTPIPHLKNVVIIPCAEKPYLQSICDLYGGEPILVVDAQHHSYEYISSLHSDTFEQERVVCVTPDFPYWHHTFKVEEQPFGFFKVKKDKSALSCFCSICLKNFDSTSKKTECDHIICDNCSRELNPVCLHASHKREYIPFEDLLLFEDMDVTYCIREGCEGIVDPRVSCTDCGEGGFCSNLCLLLIHEC